MIDIILDYFDWLAYLLFATPVWFLIPFWCLIGYCAISLFNGWWLFVPIRDCRDSKEDKRR